MKISNRNKLLCLALTGSFSLFSATNAFAAATDIIANTATLGYDVGGAAQTVIESSPLGNSTPGLTNGAPTEFREDRLINFNVVRGPATGVAVPGGLLQSVQYTVTNTGNGAQGFLLKGINNADLTADPFGGSADEFDATLVQTFVENTAAGVPGYDPTDTEAFIASLAVGASADVYVVSTIPLVDTGGNPLVNTNVAVMSLVAQVAINNSFAGAAADAIMEDDNGNVSTGGNGFTNGTADLNPLIVGGASNADGVSTVEIVFNDAVGTQDGAGAADIAQNAQHSDDSSYTITTAALTVTKVSSALWDFVNLNNNPKSIPGGSVVRYTVTVFNAVGAADATLTSIVDDLPLSIQSQFGDGTAANNPVSGANNVRITDGLGAVVFCQADPGDAAPADGCDSALGGTADRLSVDLSLVAGITNVLQANQTLTIVFDVTLP